MSIDKGTVEKLMELRDPGSDSLCKHDWVGDDECAYCRIDELERQLAEKDAKLEELRESIDVCKDAYVFNMKEIAEKAAEIEKQNSNLLFYATENLKLKHRLRDIAYPPEY